MRSTRSLAGSGLRTTRLSRGVCGGAITGATFGILSGWMGKAGRSNRMAAAGGVIGVVVGMGTVLAWNSRRFTGSATRNAVRRMNAVRDARWLEKNPIAYA